MPNSSFHKAGDTQLVQNLIQGDIGAFDALYYRYHRQIFANIRTLIYDTAMAEDVLQEVFMALWENRHRLDVTQSVSGWLFTVSQNKCLKLLRKLLKEKVCEIEEKDIAAYVEEENEGINAGRLALAEAAINMLPARKKQVFNLCVVEGKSYNEASEILGISIFTVKEYIKGSYKFIREHVSDNQGVLYLLCLYIVTRRP